MSEKTSKIVSNHEAVDESDPGAIILFASDGDIHVCLGLLPALPPNLPHLIRGMNIK